MYPAPFRYHRPDSLQDAIALLARLGDDAKPLSGGQTLIPMLKLRVGRKIPNQTILHPMSFPRRRESRTT